jgi:hypothetical protein
MNKISNKMYVVKNQSGLYWVRGVKSMDNEVWTTLLSEAKTYNSISSMNGLSLNKGETIVVVDDEPVSYPLFMEITGSIESSNGSIVLMSAERVGVVVDVSGVDSSVPTYYDIGYYTDNWNITRMKVVTGTVKITL